MPRLRGGSAPVAVPDPEYGLAIKVEYLIESTRDLVEGGRGNLRPGTGYVPTSIRLNRPLGEGGGGPLRWHYATTHAKPT